MPPVTTQRYTHLQRCHSREHDCTHVPQSPPPDKHTHTLEPMYVGTPDMYTSTHTYTRYVHIHEHQMLPHNYIILYNIMYNIIIRMHIICIYTPDTVPHKYIQNMHITLYSIAHTTHVLHTCTHQIPLHTYQLHNTCTHVQTHAYYYLQTFQFQIHTCTYIYQILYHIHTNYMCVRAYTFAYR